MSPCRLLAVFSLTVWIGGAMFASPVLAQWPEAMPLSVAPPQQSVAGYAEQPAYPSTSAEAFTPYPSTAGAGSVPSAPSYDGAPWNGDAQGPGASYPSNDGAGATSGFRPLDANDYVERVLTGEERWSWEILPTGLLYKTDLAGPHEPRMGGRFESINGLGGIWDCTLGARVGIIRYGTENDFWPQGWQLDAEGAAFPRLDASRNLISNDYTFGVPLTTRQGPWEWKFGYRHYCSHIGDLYLLAHPDFDRINYVRDSLVSGIAFYPDPNVRLYAEADWSFHNDGGAEPWEFQFGMDFSPAGPTSAWGAPFFAVAAHLRQENDFGGSLTVETGWQWRGRTGHLLRFGAHYFNGMSEQAQFYKTFEQQIGGGLWYDF